MLPLEEGFSVLTGDKLHWEFLRSAPTQKEKRKTEAILLGFTAWFTEKTLGIRQPSPSSHFLEKEF